MGGMRSMRGMGGVGTVRAVVSHHLTLVTAFENKGELLIAMVYQKILALGINFKRVRGVCSGLDNLMGSDR